MVEFVFEEQHPWSDLARCKNRCHHLRLKTMDWIKSCKRFAPSLELVFFAVTESSTLTNIARSTC